MADYSTKAPGVYVEEVPSAVKPIAGRGHQHRWLCWHLGRHYRRVEPSRQKSGMPAKPAGGPMPRPPSGSPQALNSWTEFTQKFGDIQAANQYLAHAVYGFFNNGGTRCWVARVAAVADVAKALDLI